LRRLNQAEHTTLTLSLHCNYIGRGWA